MLDKTVVRVLSHQRAGGLFHLFPGNPGKNLPRVLIHLFCADVEAIADHAHGSVGEQGQGGGIVVGDIYRVRGQGVCRSDERGHSQFFHLDGIAAFRVKPHGVTPRQQEQFAFRRKRHEFIRAGQRPFPAMPAEHEQVGIIVYPALRVGKKQTGQRTGICGHGNSVGIGLSGRGAHAPSLL